jgi:hypothetical protein
MSGTNIPPAGSIPMPRRSTGTAHTSPDGIPAVPETGNARPGTAGTARRHNAAAATAPITGKPHKPCSSPPKPRPAAYDRRPGPGPDRAPRRAQRQSEPTRQVRVELPDEPPQLTPDAALALLRVLVKARAARRHEDGDQPVPDHSIRPASDHGRKG